MPTDRQRNRRSDSTFIDSLDRDLGRVEDISDIMGTYFDPLPYWADAMAYSTMGASTVFLKKFRVDRAFRATGIQMDINVGAVGFVDANIYSEAAGTWTRLGAVSTPIATDTQGVKLITIGSPVDLLPGVDYYMAIALDNATAQPLRMQTSASGRVSALDNDFLNKGASYPLPATLASMSTNQNVIWGRVRGAFI